MCPIEISAHTNKHTNANVGPPAGEVSQVKEEAQEEEVTASQQEGDLNNNRQHKYRKRSRSCSSAASGQQRHRLHQEEGSTRRSERLLKKHSATGVGVQQQEEPLVTSSSSSAVTLCKKEFEAAAQGRSGKMLSKIKSSALDSRASSFSQSNTSTSTSTNSNNNNNTNTNNNNNNNSNNNNSDTEDNNNDLDTNNDSNNNNLSIDTKAPISGGKMSQDELMDIVEESRRRRLSKGSADQLGSFIRWSFSNIEEQRERRASFSLFQKRNSIVIEHNNNNNTDDNVELLDEDDWSSLAHAKSTAHLSTEQLLRHHAKMAANTAAAVSQCGGSSAANLALLRQQQAAKEGARLAKRPRTHLYSPDSKFDRVTSGQRKVSSYLGNVVDRLHQQQQGQLAGGPQHQQEHEAANESESSSGLSFHLQQFLSQQTSLEDLCSSVGLDDSNQLVLAAAIHRALVDSVGTDGASGAQADPAKSTASSTGGSSVGGSSSGASTNHNQLAGGGQQSSGANLHLVDSLNSRARRTYNTRGAAGLGLAAGSGLAGSMAQQRSRELGSSTAATLAALNINSRVQQQRHAQAAAALSALANASSHHNHPHAQHNSNAHHQHLRNSIGGHSAGAISSAAPAGQSQQQQQLVTSSLQGQAPSAGASALGAEPLGNPMVDFECETCGSSFDDRHRLMQHQSIHLELKKDWFTETPVDEVMKIFNRRRGEFLCNACNLRFEATFDYDKHNHQVHGQRPYCCQFCGNGTRTFRFWRQYLNHLYDHRYIFSCTIDDCDFTVNRRDSLRFHIFRFHLNCQLPQQQTHIRSAGHQHNMLMSSADATGKWPMALGDHDEVGMGAGDADDDLDLDQDTEMNVGE